jgi:flagellar P-ring protein precursor FlgI
MNQAVTLEPCAVSHGTLSVVVTSDVVVTQPVPGGPTVIAQSTQTTQQQGGGSLLSVRGGTSLSDVVKALNAIGATPQDLLAILQAMKVAGALRAELEVI